jgi:H+/Cl- antiporter ClcA
VHNDPTNEVIEMVNKKMSIKDRLTFFVVGLVCWVGVPFIPAMWTAMSESNNSTFASLAQLGLILAIFFPFISFWFWKDVFKGKLS